MKHSFIISIIFFIILLILFNMNKKEINWKYPLAISLIIWLILYYMIPNNPTKKNEQIFCLTEWK